MKKENKIKIKHLNKSLKKNTKLNYYGLMIILFLGVLLSSTIFYFVGNNEGYNQKERELSKELVSETNKQLMEKELYELKDYFYKYLIVFIINWMPWIVMSLLLGWILHGLF